MTRPDALHALLTAARVRVVGSACSRAPLVCRRPRRRVRRAADLLVATSPVGAAFGDDAPLLALAPRPRRRPERASELWLGADAAFWTPTLQLGLSSPRRARPSGPGLLIVGDDHAAVELTLRAALARRLSVRAAVASARCWSPVIAQAARLEEPLLPAIALISARPAAAALPRRDAGRPGLLWAGGPARALTLPGPWRTATTERCAPALGWCALADLDELLAAAELLFAGLQPRSGRAGAVVADGRRRALLRALLGGCGLGPQPGQPADGLPLVRPSKRKLRQLQRETPVDALLTAGAVPSFAGQRAAGPLQLAVLPGGGEAPPISTLRALGALLQVPRLAPAAPARPRSVSSPRRAQARIEGLPPRFALGHGPLHDLLRGYGIDTPTAALVTSASAAAAAARTMRFPLRAVARGPALDLGATVRLTRRRLETVAATRQAFHDLIYACRDQAPGKQLHGVLVAEDRGGPIFVDLALLPAGGTPLLGVALLGEQTAIAEPRWRRCPIDAEGAAELCQQLLAHRALAAQNLAPRDALSLTRFLQRASWLSLDLARAGAWAALSPVSLPGAGSRPLVIDAAGARQAPPDSIVPQLR